jgi:response regulator of citrate/malate metabolism
MGFNKINCFSSGQELKTNMKDKTLDLLLMDFHLGQSKNCVEVLQDLQKQITYTTCVMFITCDRLPFIIGQIVDVHPEALVIKPYTIRNLSRSISNCLSLHEYLMPVFEMMDEDNYPQTLSRLDQLLEKNAHLKKSALVKLRAKLLTKLSRYSEATSLYRSILKKSEKVIWAKWWLIQSLFLDEHVEESETLFLELTHSELTGDRACEWLARISVNNNQYNKAKTLCIRSVKVSYQYLLHT